METILKNGIIIKDNRNIDCGISIENQNTKYITLGYSSKDGFYLNLKGLWLSQDECSDYYYEFEAMRMALIEANTKIK